MPNTMLTADIIAKEALMKLRNNLILASKVYRGYEAEYDKNINGYKVGDKITIRKPAQFTFRTGEVMSPQPVIEGSTTLVLDKVGGADFNFTSVDLTLKIGELSERVLEPAMIRIADKIDEDLFSLYKQVNNWVGTPGVLLSNYGSFAAGTTRMNNLSVPRDNRTGCISPDDKQGILANLTGPQSLFNQEMVKDAYRRGLLGQIDGVDVYDAQNVANLTTGTRTNGTNNGAVPTTYEAVKDTGTQLISITGLGANATISAGEVFTFAGVFDVNQVNKATLSFLKQFAVTAAATATAGGVATVIIRPAMILSGAFQNISAAPASNAALTWKGAASTIFRQNMIFHRNAFALAIVPLIKPPGAVEVSRETEDGISVRVIPVYDGTNNNSSWRLDILYGFACIDERIATRLSGT